MKKKRWTLVAGIVTILLGGSIFLAIIKFEGEKPVIDLRPDSKYLGEKISLIAEDRKSGVSDIIVEASQHGKTLKLFSERFPRKTGRVEKFISLRPLPEGLKEGEVHIRLLVRDHSWMRGNPVLLERDYILDITPPQVALLGTLHYINKGGTGLITYRTSEETPLSGVQVGEELFQGHRAEKNRYLVYFALPHNAPSSISILAYAEDLAGNRTRIAFHPVIKEKNFKKDKINLTDTFLNKVAHYFMSIDPNLKGSPIDIFLWVNKKQRDRDHQEIKRLCRNTYPRQLWSGPFLRLPNSKPMATFAEERSYWYNGKEVDQQIHLGIDLASIAQSPVPVANSGMVRFAGPLGIYGNTVIVDHGLGLFSMYSHLSTIGTDLNKEVKKGEIIGRTGSTGLAGGDHLHFSIIVNGIFVNPIEWWDEHWIKDNVELKMKLG